MDVYFEVHGVMSHGQTSWQNITDYYKSFYTPERGEDEAFIVEVQKSTKGTFVYYTLFFGSVVAASGRPGSYFAMTISTNELLSDFQLVYILLKNFFNENILNTILKETSGRYQYLCDDFESQESILKDIENRLFGLLGGAIQQQNILKIPPTYRKINEVKTIDCIDFSSKFSYDILQGRKIISLPNLIKDNYEKLKKQLAESTNLQQEICALKASIAEKEQKLANAQQKIQKLEQSKRLLSNDEQVDLLSEELEQERTKNQQLTEELEFLKNGGDSNTTAIPVKQSIKFPWGVVNALGIIVLIILSGLTYAKVSWSGNGIEGVAVDTISSKIINDMQKMFNKPATTSEPNNGSIKKVKRINIRGLSSGNPKCGTEYTLEAKDQQDENIRDVKWFIIRNDQEEEVEGDKLNENQPGKIVIKCKKDGYEDKDRPITVE